MTGDAMLPNLTNEQLDLLRTLARVYRSGCTSAFVLLVSLTERRLVYPDHENVSVSAETTDFEQLAVERLITLGHNSQDLLRGKITARGLTLAKGDVAVSDTAASSRSIGRVFIGHGRSATWRELKDFVVERLGLEYDEFNREPAAGITTKERLEEMLARTDFALLVLTAEDEQLDGTVRARENVVHEVGLFQGKLGFRRAIVLLEEGCQPFSNIHGLTPISFPKGRIAAALEEIRRVIEREHQAGTPVGVAGVPEDAHKQAGRTAYALAVSILRNTYGQCINTGTATEALPGALWFGRERDWPRLARPIGEYGGPANRFTPFVEPTLFDGGDDTLVRSAQRILDLYLWGADNFTRFDDVRREFDLPDPTEVRALLADLG